ncbi:terminase large subunit [Caminicella sporogenes]|uniref:terminase large subunit n=1 Tax=Caminicella sporogenes TaxID=166485 RepID=UPI0025417F7A|nr:terminase TerL endonuclease subunit [Caminicella sporogenes]WIF95131.1 terminase large subunit [Caminicella sporogenes]
MGTPKIFNELIKYSKDITSGKEIACKKHMLACERFLRDVKRQGTKEFPYIWDEKEAAKIVKWFTYCKHSKGILTDKPIILKTFQKFIVCNIYGWKHKDTGYRRFRKAYIQVARKNGKSQLQAGMGLYELMARGINASEVYCLGTKRDQSKIVFREAILMAGKHIKKRLKITNKNIRHEISNSFMEPMSKEAGKTGDGLNPQMAIIDEYHAHPTSAMYDVMVSGMAARPEPIIVIITTAGEDFENKPCYAEYQYCSKILQGVTDNEQYFVLICELDEDDDIKDERNWIKANPIVATYPEGIEYLRGELKTALEDPDKMRTFLTKNMNRWVKEFENTYINIDYWKNCKQDITWEDVRGKNCYVGVDLSSTGDLTSVSFEFPIINDSGEKKYIVFSHSFIPAKTLQHKINTDKAPYDMWHKKGLLTATQTNKGLINDYNFVVRYIEDKREKYDLNIIMIGYDKHQAGMFVSEMEELGYECVEVKQSCRNLNDATIDFRDQVKVGNIIHDGNELLTWSIANAVTISNSFGEIKIDKDLRVKRIDPIDATINAHYLAMNYWNDGTTDLNQKITDDFLDKLGW